VSSSEPYISRYYRFTERDSSRGAQPNLFHPAV
jgi:hypothetical protein